MRRTRAPRPDPATSTAAPRRSRDATATRAAILDAARRAFASRAYDQVGMRDLAADVGVDPALVVRYFGGKEHLFEEAVTREFHTGALRSLERSALGSALARLVLEKSDHNPLFALLNSAPHPQASAALRRALDDDFIRPLAVQLGGDDAELRASLLTAYLLGLAVVHGVLRSGPMNAFPLEELIARVASTIQQYVDPPGDRVGGARATAANARGGRGAVTTPGTKARKGPAKGARNT